MGNESKFVSGGGWVSTVESGRPLTRGLVFGAVMSCVPALGGVIFAFHFDSPSLWQGMLTFPSWALILPTPLLTVFSVVAYLLEPPRTVITEQPNPNCDPRNLY